MPIVDFTAERLALLNERGMQITSLRGPQNFRAPAVLEPPGFIGAEIVFNRPFRMGAFSLLMGGLIQSATIGRYCSIARDAQIGHGAHPTDWLSVSPLQYHCNYHGWEDFVARQGYPVHPSPNLYDPFLPTVIGNDVWMGNHVFVKCGVTIGDGAIIGAFSVVTKDVPPYMIVAGNPARIVRPRFPEKTVERLLRLKWWRYAIPNLPRLPYQDAERAVDQLEKLIETGGVREYSPEPIRFPDFFETPSAPPAV